MTIARRTDAASNTTTVEGSREAMDRHQDDVALNNGNAMSGTSLHPNGGVGGYYGVWWWGFAWLQCRWLAARSRRARACGWEAASGPCSACAWHSEESLCRGSSCWLWR